MTLTPQVYKEPGQHPYTIGRGLLYIKRPTEDVWQSFEHVKEFKITNASESQSHMNMSGGMAFKDAAALKSLQASGNIVFDVVSRNNLLLYLYSNSITDASQSSGSWTAEEFTVDTPDKWQKLGKRSIAMTAITDDASPTPAALVEGTDYLVNWETGMFLAISTSSKIGAAGDKFRITGTYAAVEISQIKAGTATSNRFELEFHGNPTKGTILNCYALVDVKPSGDISFIGEDWMQFTLEFDCVASEDYGDLGYLVEEVGTIL